MLMLLSATTLILAAMAYALALCNKMVNNNVRCQYALNYCHVRMHHQN